MFYINYRYNTQIETIDSFETEEEAEAMLAEYQLVGGGCLPMLLESPG
jgi:hypothetical protein